MQVSTQSDEHGTVTGHNHGCRCLKCRAAMCEYDRQRRIRTKAGQADFIVSSELASAHLWELSRAGMGLRAVAELTGISRRNLYWIRSRKMRCRQSTEQRIMRVKTHERGETLKSGGAPMRAREAKHKVDEMVAGGWSKLAIGRAMGNANLWWYGRERIRVSTHLRFQSVYEQFKREQRKAA